MAAPRGRTPSLSLGKAQRSSAEAKKRRARMSGQERREQLIDVGRSLFAQKGFQATSIEEIALRAKITKPLIYEHFGGKEGLYAVVVDREVKTLLDPDHRQSRHGASETHGGWWIDVGKPRIEVVAAHLVNVAWNGLGKLDTAPGLATISGKKTEKQTLT